MILHAEQTGTRPDGARAPAIDEQPTDPVVGLGVVEKSRRGNRRTRLRRRRRKAHCSRVPEVHARVPATVDDENIGVQDRRTRHGNVLAEAPDIGPSGGRVGMAVHYGQAMLSESNETVERGRHPESLARPKTPPDPNPV